MYAAVILEHIWADSKQIILLSAEQQSMSNERDNRIYEFHHTHNFNRNDNFQISNFFDDVIVRIYRNDTSRMLSHVIFDEY